MGRSPIVPVDLGFLNDQSIALCGFMGVGKTSVGKKLAFRTGRTFIDLDAAIVERLGRSIPEIFAAGDEPLFRTTESSLLAELVTQAPPSVIALGGGAYADAATRDLLREHAFVIHLDQSWEALYPALSRLRESRPLLLNLSVEQIKELYEKRRESYLLADLSVEIPRAGVWVATRIVLSAISEFLKR
jgi:shikimate kinase